MEFLVPNYSCLQNPWLGGYRTPDPRSVLCPQLNLLTPPPFCTEVLTIYVSVLGRFCLQETVLRWIYFLIMQGGNIFRPDFHVFKASALRGHKDTPTDPDTDCRQRHVGSSPDRAQIVLRIAAASGASGLTLQWCAWFWILWKGGLWFSHAVQLSGVRVMLSYRLVSQICRVLLFYDIPDANMCLSKCGR